MLLFFLFLQVRSCWRNKTTRIDVTYCAPSVTSMPITLPWPFQRYRTSSGTTRRSTTSSRVSIERWGHFRHNRRYDVIIHTASFKNSEISFSPADSTFLQSDQCAMAQMKTPCGGVLHPQWWAWMLWGSPWSHCWCHWGSWVHPGCRAHPESRHDKFYHFTVHAVIFTFFIMELWQLTHWQFHV